MSLNPGDIVTKLKLLFTVVIVLFGIMNLGAVIGYVLDSHERRDVVHRLKQPAAGFHTAAADDECWLWSFHLEPLKDELAAPSGTAVVITSVLGLPFARLRAALPDELVSASLASAIGRKQVFSLQGFSDCLPAQKAMVAHMGVRRTKTGRFSPVDTKEAEADEAPAAPAQDEAQLDVLVGTALVLAFLQVAALMPVVELAKRKSAAKRHFAGVTTPAGWDFETTNTAFITLVSPGGACRERACARACMLTLRVASPQCST
jgi:hypothetical protein